MHSIKRVLKIFFLNRILPIYRKFKHSKENQFVRVSIDSCVQKKSQKAFFFKPEKPRSDVLIVSLHSWSQNYASFDPIADTCINLGLSYIHPDAGGYGLGRGRFSKIDLIKLLEEAIQYAMNKSACNINRVILVGQSGGGLMGLHFLHFSNFQLEKMILINPITDLKIWYDECMVKNRKYCSEIIQLVKSKSEDIKDFLFEEYSPIHNEIIKPIDYKIEFICGINDTVSTYYHTISYIRKMFPNEMLETFKPGNDPLDRTQIKNPTEHANLLSDGVLFHREKENLSLTIIESDHYIKYNQVSLRKIFDRIGI